MTPADQAESTRSRGDAVEDAALAYLQQQGLQLLARNLSVRGGELDLVMLEGGSVVFVEVRHRASSHFGGGAASVDARKQRKIVLSATRFLADHADLANAACRFDVIEGTGDTSAPTLSWIRDAFRADDC